MRILITNDDGIEAEGLLALAKAFVSADEHGIDNEVIIVAPDKQRSAAGHSITINRPIIVKEYNLSGITAKAYSTDGTPADCVKLGVEKLCGGNVDMVVSGINFGSNLGSDVIYSGTVSAAIEGAICRIPSFAVSLDIEKEGYNFELAARLARRIILQAMKQPLEEKEKLVLNINVPGLPEHRINGVRVSELGNRIYHSTYLESKLEAEDGSHAGYRISGIPKDENIPGTDTYDLQHGYVTVTPLHYDLTSYRLLRIVNEWYREVY